MGKYLKNFNTKEEYEAFKAGGEYLTPNVSFIETAGSVINDNAQIECDCGEETGVKLNDLLDLNWKLYVFYADDLVNFKCVDIVSLDNIRTSTYYKYAIIDLDPYVTIIDGAASLTNKYSYIFNVDGSWNIGDPIDISKSSWYMDYLNSEQSNDDQNSTKILPGYNKRAFNLTCDIDLDEKYSLNVLFIGGSENLHNMEYFVNVSFTIDTKNLS